MAKVPNTEENKGRCKCPGCPTWQSDGCPKAKGENLYCAQGKTTCSLQDQGCICGACPVFEQYALEGGYFCFNGEAQ